MWRYNYTSNSYCNNHNCYSKGSKPVNVNSGSGSTLAKKTASKYSKKLNNTNGNFSLNGSNNNSYVGNPNNAISYTQCLDVDTKFTPKTSVKNYSGYMKTRIVNNNIKCNTNNSFDCYKTANSALVDANLNKHFNSNSSYKDQSSRIQLLKSKCSLERNNYNQLIQNNKGTNNCSDYTTSKSTSTNRTLHLATKCNITKDINQVNGYTPGYSLYYNDTTLFKKKSCLYNPPDAKIIAC